MALPSILVLPLAAAAGYAVARRLLREDAPERIEALPEPARGPATAARGRLQRARDRAAAAMAEVRHEVAAAEAELTEEYHRQAGRQG